jgi:acyl carrier protein
MDPDPIGEKILSTLAAVLQLDRAAVNERASVDTVPAWDSLKHMDLVIALEDALGVQFADDEVAELISYRLIRSIVGAKLPGGERR